MIVLRMLTALAWVAVASSALAFELKAPTGKVVLTVTGQISAKNTPDAAEFDMSMLEALEWQEIESYTYYTEGAQKFEGPRLSELLSILGATGQSVRAVALDDYLVEIPVSDLADHEILLALRHNGDAMRVRDRGPIWVIYPSAAPEDIGDKHISRSIWQLKSLHIQP